MNASSLKQKSLFMMQFDPPHIEFNLVPKETFADTVCVISLISIGSTLHRENRSLLCAA